jgi:hypothetical protein
MELLEIQSECVDSFVTRLFFLWQNFEFSDTDYYFTNTKMEINRC